MSGVRGLWGVAVAGSLGLCAGECAVEPRASADTGDVALATSSVPVQPAALAPDPDAARLSAAGHSLKWNWVPPGQSERFGHAETLIHAPLASVRQRVLDFSHYRDIVPARFKTSRVVAHVPDGSADVYMQIAVMKDMILLWDVTRFAPAKETAPGFQVVEGKMVPGKGNVQDSAIVWTMHSLDANWTVLKLDLLLKPGLPAPQSAVDEELRDSAMNAVDMIHDRSQGSIAVGPWPG
jgi:hypothetical protein